MAKENKFASFLKKAEKTFKSAQKAGGGGGINPNVEDGKQEAKLVKAEIVEVSQGKKIMVAWSWEFEVDKKAKKKNKDAGIIVQRDGLETEQNFSHLKRKLDAFGYDPDEMNLAQDLPQVLKKLSSVQPMCEVVVKTSDDEQWQNVMLNKVLDEIESDDDADDDDADDDDDDSDADDEDGDDDADEPEYKKGMTVLFKPPKARKALECTIKKIANGKADLEDEAGKKFKGILLEKLELPDSDDDDDDADDDDDSDSDDDGDGDESEFGEITKGSKLEVKVDKKAYKATAIADPDDRKETVKVKFTTGPLKGQAKTVDQADCELLD